MAFLPGIRSINRLTANQAVASNITPELMGDFNFDCLANGVFAFEWWGAFSVGATGGCRFLVVSPAGSTVTIPYLVLNTVTPASIGSVVTVANTAFANALAVAGTHILRANGLIVNGATPGQIQFQFAQNTSDVLPITMLAGSYVQLTRVA